MNKKFINAVGTIALGVLTSFVYDWIKEKPILTSLKILTSIIYTLILSILKYKIPIWYILLFSASTVALFLVLKAIIKPNEPAFFKYTSDTFDRWKWRWNWVWDSKRGVWVINELTSHCPRCDVRLISSRAPFSSSVSCPKCKQVYQNDSVEDIRGIEARILDNVEKENFPNM